MNIGQQVGYWKAQAERREDKRVKVEKLIRRARACRTFDGLEKVGDEARESGLWHPVRVVFGECNARLRGRHQPVIYRKGSEKLLVEDNRALAKPWMTARDLCKNGYQYAGEAE